jgi:hypothetical protein
MMTLVAQTVLEQFGLRLYRFNSGSTDADAPE